MVMKKDYGKKISQAIKESGLNHDVIGEKMDRSAKTISRWVRGETLPDIDEILILAEILDRNVLYFYGKDFKTPDREIGRLEGKIEVLQDELSWYKAEIKDILSQCAEGLKNKSVRSDTLTNNRR